MLALSEIHARAQGASRRMIRLATQQLPGDTGHMRELPVAFTSGIQGTPLTVDVPASGCPIDFYGRLVGVFAGEMSHPTKITGTALFALYVQGVGETTWHDLTNGGATVGFTGGVYGGSEALPGWWRYLRPGDELLAVPATFSAVESVTVRFRIRELPHRVQPYVQARDAEGNPVVDSNGDPVVIFR